MNSLTTRQAKVAKATDRRNLRKAALPKLSHRGSGNHLRLSQPRQTTISDEIRAASNPLSSISCIGEDTYASSEQHPPRGAASTQATTSSSDIVPDLGAAIDRARPGGRPLAAQVRHDMESGFCNDFGRVRIHTGTQADLLSRALSARAFTISNHVFFRAGRYNPRTPDGRELLAHELTHVIQQTGASSRGELTIADPATRFETEADQAAKTVRDICPSRDPAWYSRLPVAQLQRQAEPTEQLSREEFLLAEQQRDYKRLIDKWYRRYLMNLATNATNARFANQRFIDLLDDAIDELRTVGSLTTGVASLFGGPGALVALCVIVLTEVAAEGLSSRSGKTAAASRRLDERLQAARREIEGRYDELLAAIDAVSSMSYSEWGPIWNLMANLGVPAVVPENIIYRDLLLQLARSGGYNISGSQWNVENMAPFGDAEWYHSWDWCSPGWINGRDIAEELNELARADPSTRIRVRISPP